MPSSRHDRDVLGVAVVVVVGDVSGRTVRDLARGMGERVPDAGAATVISDSALDLIRRGGRPPHEVRWNSN